MVEASTQYERGLDDADNDIYCIYNTQLEIFRLLVKHYPIFILPRINDEVGNHVYYIPIVTE